MYEALPPFYGLFVFLCMESCTFKFSLLSFALQTVLQQVTLHMGHFTQAQANLKEKYKRWVSFAFATLVAVAKLPSLKIVAIYSPIISISHTLAECVLAVYIAKKKIVPFWFKFLIL